MRYHKSLTSFFSHCVHINTIQKYYIYCKVREILIQLLWASIEFWSLNSINAPSFNTKYLFLKFYVFLPILYINPSFLRFYLLFNLNSSIGVLHANQLDLSFLKEFDFFNPFFSVSLYSFKVHNAGLNASLTIRRRELLRSSHCLNYSLFNIPFVDID